MRRGALQFGREPVQARARRTVDAILDAAAEGLVATGTPLNLTAVAERAGVSIGSLYQYFPSSAALVHELARRHLRTIGGQLVEELTNGSERLDRTALRTAIVTYLDVAQKPLEIAIMRAIRADPALRAMDRADTVANADRLSGALAATSTDRDGIRARIELVIELSGALAVVLADLSRRDRRRLVEPFLDLVDRSLRPTAAER